MNEALRHGNQSLPATKQRWGLLALAMVLAFAATVPTWYRPHAPQSNRTTAVQLMLTNLNQLRAARGLPELRLSTKLDYAALQHADDMIARNYFDHVSPTGSTPFTRMHADGISYVWAGENIAESDTQSEAEQALWESPEHRANILNPHYKHVGISIMPRPDGELVFVQEFTN